MRYAVVTFLALACLGTIFLGGHGVVVLTHYLAGRWPLGSRKDDRAAAVAAACRDVVLAGIGFALAASALHTHYAPSAPDLSTIALYPANAGILVSRVPLQTAFLSGEACAVAAKGERPSVEFQAVSQLWSEIERHLSANRQVVVIIMGGHDIDPLSRAARRTYESNAVLAQRRADCVANALTQKVGAHRLDDVFVLPLPAGAHHLFGDREDIAQGKTEDRQARAVVIAWPRAGGRP